MSSASVLIIDRVYNGIPALESADGFALAGLLLLVAAALLWAQHGRELLGLSAKT